MNHNSVYNKLFAKQNVQKQLMSMYILTIVVPVLIVGGIIWFFTYRQFTDNYEHLSRAKAMQARSVLLSTTLSLSNVYDYITSDDTLPELLSGEYDSYGEAFSAFSRYKNFEQALSNNAYLSELKLYVAEDTLQTTGNIGYFYAINEEVRQTDWYQKAESTFTPFYDSSIRVGQADNEYWELHYYCRIPLPNTGSFAVLAMSVSNDQLRNLIQDENYDIYIAVNDDPVFFSSTRSYAGNGFPQEIENRSDYYNKTGKMDLLGRQVIGSLQTFRPSLTSDRIYILAADPDSVSYIRNILVVFILSFVFAITIAALLVYLYSRYFSDRIQTLRLAMHKAANNDYEIVDTIQGDDELTATFQDMKSMAEKLKRTEAQIYQAKINEQILSNQQQQMELKLLANQINPHFLYNTLETIRMKAFYSGDREVATAIKLLGKSMRYVLNNTKITSTTLDKEIDYIRTYLAIQKLRFEERLDYTIRIDENFHPEQYQILPLLIQPIVENAIAHGITPTGERGHLILKICKSGDLLVTNVFDNGCGMTPDVLERTIAHLRIPRPEAEHGVGLYNINNRVQLYYGTQYGLTIQSRAGEGTLVTLTIPLCNLTEEEE